MASGREELLEALNEALGAEYGTLWLLPQHMAQVKDEELKRQLKLIAEVELEHAEQSAEMIYQLGGKPSADLPNLRPRSGVREILEAHLEGEREAVELYGRAIRAAEDPEVRKKLERMRREEEGHRRLLERALGRL
ncbi:MAG: ferritin-like domain-containing protein [Armatimonadota bacterium]|nr:MAG: ferritin-like domain-containing protein [Armatimonadota bacterium]